MRRFLRDPRFRHERWVTLYALVYLASLAIVPIVGAPIDQISDLLYFGIGGATVWTQYRLSRIGTTPRTRRAWRFIMASCASLWVGGLAWTVMLSYGAEAEPLVISLLVEGGYVLLAFLGLVTLPANPRATWRDPHLRFDGALLAFGGLALIWHFDFLPYFEHGSDFIRFGVFSIIGEWAVAIAASIAFLRARTTGTRDAVAFLLAAHLVYIFSDFLWGVSGTAYTPGHWIDTVWFSAWLFRWAGARRALHAAIREAEAPSATLDEGYYGGIAPSLFVMGAYVILLLALQADSTESAMDIGVASVAMTALLLARQRHSLTENRRLAAETAAQADRFRALAASSTDLVLVVDTDRDIRYRSPSVERIAGLVEGERLDVAIHPEDREALAAWLPDTGTGPGLRAFRCRLRDTAGAWRDVAFRAQDRRADPLVRGYVLNGRDITAELALEAELGHARKLATLSEMAGRIAHAFNNALAVVQGHAELLADTLPPHAPAREDVRAIRAAADRGAGITRQLLGFSGRHVIRPEPLVPRDVVTDLAPTLRRLLPVGVTLDLSSLGSSRWIRADRAQFEQVIVNLVANARDAMPAGGTVRIATGDHADGVQLHVQDEGTGVPSEMRGRIFEPFFTTKAPGRGTGLGLAMVASIIARAGGRIEVLDAPERGSIFSLTLPAIESHAGGTSERPSMPVVPTELAEREEVVLLVDDDAAVLRTSSRILRRAGYVVRETSDGATALAIAARLEERIDLLVTDLMMPGVSGREVIEGFRRLRPSVPIVCVTGFAAARADDAELAPRVHAIVAKPFRAETLEAAVAAAIASGSPRP